MEIGRHTLNVGDIMSWVTGLSKEEVVSSAPAFASMLPGCGCSVTQCLIMDAV